MLGLLLFQHRQLWNILLLQVVAVEAKTGLLGVAALADFLPHLGFQFQLDRLLQLPLALEGLVLIFQAKQMAAILYFPQ